MNRRRRSASPACVPRWRHRSCVRRSSCPRRCLPGLAELVEMPTRSTTCSRRPTSGALVTRTDDGLSAVAADAETAAVLGVAAGMLLLADRSHRLRARRHADPVARLELCHRGCRLPCPAAAIRIAHRRMATSMRIAHAQHDARLADRDREASARVRRQPHQVRAAPSTTASDQELVQRGQRELKDGRQGARSTSLRSAASPAPVMFHVKQFLRNTVSRRSSAAASPPTSAWS